MEIIQMTLQEFTDAIKGKAFKDQFSIWYEFIAENTLRINRNPSTAGNYTILEDKNVLYLKHNSLLGTEDMQITLIKKEPLKFSITERFSRNRNLILEIQTN